MPLQGSGEALAWDPCSVGDPAVMSLHTASPPSDANEADYDGYERFATAGERWTRNPDGTFANADAYDFPPPPPRRIPQFVAVRCGGRIELAGRLKAKRAGGRLRIAAGALALAARGDA